MSKNRELDAKDLQMIGALRQNASTPIRALGRRLGMRPSTVHARIRRLLQRGIIRRYTIEVDHEKLGNDFLAFVLVKGGPEKYLEGGFLGRAEVEGAYPVTGEHDLLLKLRFRSMKEFNRFLVEFRERYRKNVRETLTLVALGSLKD